MGLTLELPDGVRLTLALEAARANTTPEILAAEALAQRFPADDPERRARAVAVLQSFLDEDDNGEQKETFDDLARELDAYRAATGQRLLFPPELKGKTW